MTDKNEILLLYAQEVEKDAKNGIDYLFHNEGNDHALIICSNIFKNAKQEIRIAANQLYNDEVVNKEEYINSMREFLDKKGTKLKILITQAPPIHELRKNDSFYGMLYEHSAYKEGRITIKEGRGKSFTDYRGNPVNFCTADDRMYRFENDIIARKAIANFGDSEQARKLREKFDCIYDGNGYTAEVNLANYFV